MGVDTFANDNGSILKEEKTFSNVLGQAVWLMSMDENYKQMPIGMIEGRVLPPIILRQFKLYYKEKQPVAFLTWALLDEPVNKPTDLSRFTGQNLIVWRSGSTISVIDCVSPFADGTIFQEAFLNDITANVTPH